MVKIAFVKINISNLSLDRDWDSCYIQSTLSFEDSNIQWVSVTEEEYELLRKEYALTVDPRYQQTMLLAVQEPNEDSLDLPDIRSYLETIKKKEKKRQETAKKRREAAAKRKATAEKKKKEKELKLLEELKEKYGN